MSFGLSTVLRACVREKRRTRAAVHNPQPAGVAPKKPLGTLKTSGTTSKSWKPGNISIEAIQEGASLKVTVTDVVRDGASTVFAFDLFCVGIHGWNMEFRNEKSHRGAVRPAPPPHSAHCSPPCLPYALPCARPDKT